MQLKYKRIEPAQADVAITQTEESAEDFLIFLSSSSSFIIIVVVVVVDLEFIIGLFFVINLGCALLAALQYILVSCLRFRTIPFQNVGLKMYLYLLKAAFGHMHPEQKHDFLCEDKTHSKIRLMNELPRVHERR